MIATPMARRRRGRSDHEAGRSGEGQDDQPDEAPTATAANQPKPLGVSSSR